MVDRPTQAAEAVPPNLKRLMAEAPGEYKRRSEDPEGWLASLKAERYRLLQAKHRRKRLQVDLANRHSKAAKKRMRLLVEQADTGGPDDGFGARDSDWQVYQDIGKDGSTEAAAAAAELARLQFLDGLLEEHTFQQRQQEAKASGGSGTTLLELGLERMAAPELLFQPSMVGSDVAGLDEALCRVVHGYEPAVQLQLASNVFVTGGLAGLAGFRARIEASLRAEMPFGSTVAVYSASRPQLDAWRGASAWAAAAPESAFITRANFAEMGPQYLAEHHNSNTPP